MNDSPYGLTASVWTNAAADPASQRVFDELFVEHLECGTVFLNRCAPQFSSTWCGGG